MAEKASEHSEKGICNNKSPVCFKEKEHERKKNHSGKNIFISFNADPVPVVFYAAMQNLKCNFKSDVPYMSVKDLPGGSIAILRKNESPEVYSRRFKRTLHKLCETAEHNIYTVFD